VNHHLIAFGITTAPPTLTTADLVAGRRLADFTQGWQIVCDAGRWGCQRAVIKNGFSVNM
jgi:hypothetical protein